MAKKTLLSVDGTYRKTKKGLLTVNGVYRKVKKAFTTIAGVYRPCWSSGLEYYGTITPLSAGVINPAATNIPEYALFAGGDKGTSGLGTNNPNRYSAIADAYDKNLTRTTAEVFTTSRTYVAAARLGNLAMFGGGSRGTDTKLDDVFAVNSSLTATKAVTNMTTDCDNASATSVGDYVIFANGVATGGGWLANVDVYNSSLTKITGVEATTRKSGRRAATTVGNYAIFAGGMYGTSGTSYATTIDVYAGNTMTKVGSGITIELSSGRAFLAATTVGNYAIFAGGTKDGTRQATVDVFNDSLVAIKGIDALSEARSAFPATTIEDCALFIGGELKGGKSATVDAYDANLVHTVPQALSEGRNVHAVTTVGSFVLIGGGNMASAVSTNGTQLPVDSVEAYSYS